MSVREARLCDSDRCNNPAEAPCALCTLDRCKQHLGIDYIGLAVIKGEMGHPVINAFLGKCPAATVCVEYSRLLNVFTTGAHVDGAKLPLSGLITPLRGKLVVAAAAFLAEQKLKPPA